MIPARTDRFPQYDCDLHIVDGKLANSVVATTGWANGRMLRQFIAADFTPLVDSKGQETTFELTHTGTIENVKRRREQQHHILTVLMNMGTVETAGNALRDIGCEFPYPKPVTLMQYLVSLAPSDGVVLDFFGGSGTTSEAVVRLNEDDGGQRRSILVTNNEVVQSTAARLRGENLRPGDPEWEAYGVYEAVAQPRIETIATGIKLDGSAHSEGLSQNVEFFTLTYEAPLRVSSHREFERIAPLLWLRAGSRGRRIDVVCEGWDVAETYGVLADLDQVDKFIAALDEHPLAELAFIVTDEDRLFESVVRDLPEHVEPVRLYESYLRNFEIEAGRGGR